MAPYSAISLHPGHRPPPQTPLDAGLLTVASDTAKSEMLEALKIGVARGPPVDAPAALFFYSFPSRTTLLYLIVAEAEDDEVDLYAVRIGFLTIRSRATSSTISRRLGTQRLTLRLIPTSKPARPKGPEEELKEERDEAIRGP
jgi:hypothetical protein